MSFCVYAYLDDEIVVVLLLFYWRYVETVDLVLLRELSLLLLRLSAGAPLFGNQTRST